MSTPYVPDANADVEVDDRCLILDTEDSKLAGYVLESQDFHVGDRIVAPLTEDDKLGALHTNREVYSGDHVILAQTEDGKYTALKRRLKRGPDGPYILVNGVDGFGGSDLRGYGASTFGVVENAQVMCWDMSAETWEAWKWNNNRQVGFTDAQAYSGGFIGEYGSTVVLHTDQAEYKGDNTEKWLFTYNFLTNDWDHMAYPADWDVAGMVLLGVPPIEWSGDLYVFGSSNVGGVTSFVYKWNGVAWSNTGLSTSSGSLFIYARTIWNSNLVIAGWNFTVDIAGNALWKYNGVAWSNFPQITNGWAYAVAEFQGDLYFSGMNIQIGGGGALMRGLFKYDGSTFTHVANFYYQNRSNLLYYPSYPSALWKNDAGDKLLIAGNFHKIELIADGSVYEFSRLAWWDGSSFEGLGTSHWDYYSPIDRNNFALEDSGNLYISGGHSLGGLSEPGVAVHNGKGWRFFEGGRGLIDAGGVNSIVLKSGKFFISADSSIKGFDRQGFIADSPTIPSFERSAKHTLYSRSEDEYFPVLRDWYAPMYLLTTVDRTAVHTVLCCILSYVQRYDWGDIGSTHYGLAKAIDLKTNKWEFVPWRNPADGEYVSGYIAYHLGNGEGVIVDPAGKVILYSTLDWKNESNVSKGAFLEYDGETATPYSIQAPANGLWWYGTGYINSSFVTIKNFGLPNYGRIMYWTGAAWVVAPCNLSGNDLNIVVGKTIFFTHPSLGEASLSMVAFPGHNTNFLLVKYGSMATASSWYFINVRVTGETDQYPLVLDIGDPYAGKFQILVRVDKGAYYETFLCEWDMTLPGTPDRGVIWVNKIAQNVWERKFVDDKQYWMPVGRGTPLLDLVASTTRYGGVYVWNGIAWGVDYTFESFWGAYCFDFIERETFTSSCSPCA